MSVDADGPIVILTCDICGFQYIQMGDIVDVENAARVEGWTICDGKYECFKEHRDGKEVIVEGQ